MQRVPMDVHRARAFLAVADELHFGRAAARLHMAQSPLSRLIRDVEHDLGVALFVRTSRSVALTPAGAAIVAPAGELVAQAARILDVARRSADAVGGTVRIGFAGQSVQTVLAEIAAGVRSAHPGIALDLQSARFSGSALERVRAGELDLAIGRWDDLPDDIDAVTLGTEDIVLALPTTHPVAASDPVPAHVLADEAWIVLPGGGTAALPNRIAALAAAGGFRARIAQTTADSATQLLLVGAGAGIALTFSGVAATIHVDGVVFRRLDPAPDPADVRLVWRRGDDDPALRAVLGVVRSFSAETSARSS